MTIDAGKTIDAGNTHSEMAMSTTTADDILARKQRDGGVIFAGHPMAKALKAAGVDTNFTLCGGHYKVRRD